MLPWWEVERERRSRVSAETVALPLRPAGGDTALSGRKRPTMVDNTCRCPSLPSPRPATTLDATQAARTALQGDAATD